MHISNWNYLHNWLIIDNWVDGNHDIIRDPGNMGIFGSVILEPVANPLICMYTALCGY